MHLTDELMKIIKITQKKKEKLTDCIEKMLRYGGKAMQQLEELDDDDMGERDDDDPDDWDDDDDDVGYRNGGGMGQRRYRREGGMGERRSRRTGRFIR